MKKLSFDGNLTLGQLQTTVGTTENMEFLRLVRMEKSADSKENIGEFEDADPSADAPAEITLIPSPAEAPSGKNLVFESTLYVEGDEIAVSAFR